MNEVMDEVAAVDVDALCKAKPDGEVKMKDGYISTPLRPVDAPSPCEACRGYYCRMFYLGYTREGFQEMLVKEEEEKKKGWEEQVTQIRFILNRFVPLYAPPYLGRKNWSTRRGRLSLPNTCRSYNPKTCRCMDYETRPQLCRDFKCGAFRVAVGKEDETCKKETDLTQAMFYGGGRVKQWLGDRILDHPLTVSFILWWLYGGDERNRLVQDWWRHFKSKPRSMWDNLRVRYLTYRFWLGRRLGLTKKNPNVINLDDCVIVEKAVEK
jgi:Fe-S-cluster containining protein